MSRNRSVAMCGIRHEKEQDIGNSSRLPEVMGDFESLGLSILRIVVVAIGD